MEQLTIDEARPIKGIKEPQTVRFLLYHNGNLSHISMQTILGPLEQNLTKLEQRLTKIEEKLKKVQL